MNRKAAVYVGTNNGVLHAFDPNDSGKEIFAFVPRPFVSRLPSVTSPNFVRSPMLDAPPTIAEAQFSFTGAASDWRSVLIAGYGGGAQGVFALNVTDPASFTSTTGSVLWDFSDTDDAKMGNLTSAPKLYKFRTGTNSFKWFAVVPSGYNNNKNDTPPSTTPLRHDANNQSALFLLDVTKPSSSSWTLGTNYYRIDLPMSYQDSSLPNALLSPGAELGTSGEVVTLYAGDIQGNLWKFDFSTATPPFSATNVLAFGGASGKPLFSATDTVGNRQPITIEPVVGAGTGSSNIVVFGTGKFVEASDTTVANYRQQTMYGILDDKTNTSASRVTARAELASRTASSTGSTFSVSGAGFQYGYPTSATKKKGWYFDYPGTANGERQATNLAVASSYVYFNTLAAVTPSANACAAYGGRQCAVNGSSGLSAGNTCEASSEGFLPSPNIVEPDTDVTTATTGQGNAVRTSTPLVVTLVGTPVEGAGATGAGKPIGKAGVTTKQQVKRLSWREIVDYDKLRSVYP
jgi:type IV pilus assembly protein PilY1